jgi:hypothetical protein
MSSWHVVPALVWKIKEIFGIFYIYLLLTAIGLMSGGSVYKDHTFNKETAPTFHETAKYIAFYPVKLTSDVHLGPVECDTACHDSEISLILFSSSYFAHIENVSSTVLIFVPLNKHSYGLWNW